MLTLDLDRLYSKTVIMLYKAGHARGGEGVERCRKSIHMSPGVYDDVTTVCFSSQVLQAASSVPQGDTIHLTQHPGLFFTLLT